jgi:Protein of unknown function (DUF3768)
MFFRNHYCCARCGHEWQAVWTARCEDDCPNCGARHMSPHKSENAERHEKIALLNDAFRTTLSGGKVLLSAGVAEMPNMVKAQTLCTVAAFSDFPEGNDPYGERDFGSFDLCGRKLFWKIEYFDTDLQYGSEDPADAAKTTRVMTIMLASEY